MDKWEMDRVITTMEAMNLIKIIKAPGVGITLHILGFESPFNY